MPSKNTKRASALLTTAALTLSGFAIAPIAYAADNTAAASQPASAASTVSDATMSWGLKESFRKYINGPIAHGSVDVSDGLQKVDNGILNFSGGTGTYDAATKSGTITFPGTVTYSGHKGQLDIKLNTFKLVINGDKGVLQVSGSSKDMEGNVHNFSDTDFASVDLSGAKITDESISLDGAKTTLLESGVPAFAGFYEAGLELDPITFSAPLTAPEPEETPEPSETATAEPTAEESTPATPTTPELPAYEASKGNLSEGSLSWGIKKSFRDYILANPYAKGTQTLDGVTYSDVYGFSTGTGNYDESTKTGEISFPGTIKYSAHGGVLDIALTNVTIKINGDKGEITADGYTRNGRTGEYESFTDRVIQTVDLSDLEVKDGKLVVENATTAFTDEGGATFGRYSSKDETDPVSFTATVKTAAETPAPVATETASPAPTATETADPAPTETTPAATETSAPDPAPSQNTESATRFKVESGTMNWGFKESFLKYINGPIANGSAEVGDGVTAVSNGFDWSNVTDGAFDTKTGEGFVKFGGNVHFTGHKGQLDLTFSNIQFQTYKENGVLKGYIVADVESHLLDGKPLKKEKLTIATVNLDTLNFDGKKVTLKTASTALTNSGALAFATSYDESTGEFSSMYKEGEVLTPLTLNLTLGDPISEDVDYERIDGGGNSRVPSMGETETEGTETEGTSSTGNAGTTTQSSTTLGNQSTSGASTNPGSAAIATCVPVQTTEVIPGKTTQEVTGKATVSNATMDWGLRSSFRNYIAGGIANGGWDLSGVTYNSGAFNFTGGNGSLENSKGEISFGGSIHFYGHKGILSTTFSDLSLSINGNTGVLYANVVSNNMEGQAKDYGRVAFADVDLSSLNITDQKITISSAATTLTAVGAEAFAGFYSAGEGLDPISLSGDISAETTSVKGEDQTVTKTTYQSVNGADCSELNAAANGNLAYTGLGNTAKYLVLGGALLLVAGSAAVVVARRRKA